MPTKTKRTASTTKRKTAAAKTPKAPRVPKAPKAPRVPKAKKEKGEKAQQMGLNTVASQSVVLAALKYAIKESQFEGDQLDEAKSVVARLEKRGAK